MTRVEMRQAKTQLTELVERAECGEEIMLVRDGKPAARLIPVKRGDGFASLRGVWHGQVRIGEDFDD